MRKKILGTNVRVYFSENDVESFNSKWPCSTLIGPGSFEFASNGDLVDVTVPYNAQNELDGAEWSAFAEDCKQYAFKAED